MKTATVIGAGIGGMAIAIRLLSMGYKVHVFEKAENLGGKIGSFNELGFRFDTGPSLFTLPNLIIELFELHGKNASEYIKIVDLPVTCNYFFADGTNLKAYSNREKFIAEAQKTGVAKSTLENYLEKQSFLYNNTSEFFLFNSIHKISTFVGEAGQKSLKALHRLDALKTMHRRNKLTFGKNNLVQLFDRYATYNGSDPYRAPATLNMIAHLEHNTGAFLPNNGMKGIVQAIQKLAEEEGVVFHLNEEVTRLVIAENRVQAVETPKDRYFADVVVNDTDVTYFYKNLSPDKKWYRKLAKRERSSSALIFYWGLNLSSDLDVHNILFSNNYKAEFDGLFRSKNFADDLTVYIFISKKVVAADAPTGKENWFVMVNAPENIGQNWEELAARARTIVISKIKTRINIDVEKHIEMERIMTPVDIENKTASIGGSLYGHSSNGVLSAFLRHPNFSRKYKNLYFVGGSVHPGGGIPLCLASAKIVGQLINEQK